MFEDTNPKAATSLLAETLGALIVAKSKEAMGIARSFDGMLEPCCFEVSPETSQRISELQDEVLGYISTHETYKSLRADETFMLFAKNMCMIAVGSMHLQAKHLANNHQITETFIEHLAAHYGLLREAGVPTNIIESRAHFFPVFEVGKMVQESSEVSETEAKQYHSKAQAQQPTIDSIGSSERPSISSAHNLLTRTLPLRLHNELKHFRVDDFIDPQQLEDLHWMAQERPVHLYLADSFARIKDIIQGLDPRCRSLIAYALPESEMTLVGQSFHELDKSRYHLLFPDLKVAGWARPSREKVLDAILCGSSHSHTKYQSRHLGSVAEVINPTRFSGWVDILAATGRLITEGDLNPGRVDGFIGVRVDNLLIITSTKTDKSRITAEDVCVVVDYDPESDQVSWYGQRQPSSETSCAWLTLMGSSPHRFIAHFHAKHFTYGDRYERIRSPHYVPYGVTAEAREAHRMCFEVGPFFILKGHGEFLCCLDPGDAASKIAALAKEARLGGP
jgi:hypothetical protein